MQPNRAAGMNRARNDFSLFVPIQLCRHRSGSLIHAGHGYFLHFMKINQHGVILPILIHFARASAGFRVSNASGWCHPVPIRRESPDSARPFHPYISRPLWPPLPADAPLRAA